MADVTATPAGAIGRGVANAAVAQGGTIVISSDNRDPTAVVAQATSVDSQSALVTIRSNTSPYKDQSLATKTLLSGVGPGSGTLDFNLGSLDATVSVNGTGVISGVKLFAIIRPAKDSGTFDNFRFEVGGSKPLVPQPTVYTLPVTSLMWQVVETALIPLGGGGQPFEWGVTGNSIFAQFANWRFKADWNVTTPGHVAQCDVAEAWIEVHGALGSGSEGSGIEFTFALNLPPRIIPVETTF